MRLSKHDKRVIVGLFRNFEENKKRAEKSAEEMTSEGGGIRYDGATVKKSVGNVSENKIIGWLEKKEYYRRAVEVVEHAQFFCKHNAEKECVCKEMLINGESANAVARRAFICISTVYYIRDEILTYAYLEAVELGIIEKGDY